MINYNNLSISEATQIQLELKEKLEFNIHDDLNIKTIAGADVSFNKNSNQLFAAIVILSYPDMVLKSYSLATAETNFPYVPGYLGFREIPTLLKAWHQIHNKPEVVVLDGQGILHPRRMGIAPHFGALTQQPTIGCAKSLLFGKFKEPEAAKLSFENIYDNNHHHLGYALRTKDKVSPVFVSPGYGIVLPTSLKIIKRCVNKHRIPEPTRIAHKIVNDYRLGKLPEGFNSVNPILKLF